jgi:hypothetical protein
LGRSPKLALFEMGRGIYELVDTVIGEPDGQYCETGIPKDTRGEIHYYKIVMS